MAPRPQIVSLLPREAAPARPTFTQVATPPGSFGAQEAQQLADTAKGIGSASDALAQVGVGEASIEAARQKALAEALERQAAREDVLTAIDQRDAFALTLDAFSQNAKDNGLSPGAIKQATDLMDAEARRQFGENEKLFRTEDGLNKFNRKIGLEVATAKSNLIALGDAFQKTKTNRAIDQDTGIALEGIAADPTNGFNLFSDFREEFFANYKKALSGDQLNVARTRIAGRFATRTINELILGLSPDITAARTQLKLFKEKSFISLEVADGLGRSIEDAKRAFRLKLFEQGEQGFMEKEAKLAAGFDEDDVVNKKGELIFNAREHARKVRETEAKEKAIEAKIKASKNADDIQELKRLAADLERDRKALVREQKAAENSILVTVGDSSLDRNIAAKLTGLRVGDTYLFNTFTGVVGKKVGSAPATPAQAVRELDRRLEDGETLLDKLANKDLVFGTDRFNKTMRLVNLSIAKNEGGFRNIDPRVRATLAALGLGVQLEDVVSDMQAKELGRKLRQLFAPASAIPPESADAVAAALNGDPTGVSEPAPAAPAAPVEPPPAAPAAPVELPPATPAAPAAAPEVSADDGVGDSANIGAEQVGTIASGVPDYAGFLAQFNIFVGGIPFFGSGTGDADAMEARITQFNTRIANVLVKSLVSAGRSDQSALIQKQIDGTGLKTGFFDTPERFLGAVAGLAFILGNVKSDLAKALKVGAASDKERSANIEAFELARTARNELGPDVLFTKDPQEIKDYIDSRPAGTFFLAKQRGVWRLFTVKEK